MQGYTWSSNQHPSTRYQDRPPHQYQERLPPQYQKWHPTQNQEQFSSMCYAVKNDQPNALQDQLIPQLHDTLQRKFSNGQNQWRTCSGSMDQPKSDGYNWFNQTNQIRPQYPFPTSNTQQHWQWHDSSPQNYRNTGCSQAQMYHCSSVGKKRGWGSHIYNNDSFCSMNNQQQLQPHRMVPRHHRQQQNQQWFSRKYEGKKRRRHRNYSYLAYSSGVSQKVCNDQAQSRTEANNTSRNSTTPPSGAQSNVSLPSNNINQSPVNQNQPEMESNAGPNVSATQSQNNQNAGLQSLGTSNETDNTNQTSQMTQTNEAQLQPQSTTVDDADSIIDELMCSNDNEQANNQQSNERTAHQDTCPEQSEVCATKRSDNHSKEPFSKPREQCTDEPHSKRIKYVMFQRDCPNKETIVSKDIWNCGVQSAQQGTHQTSSNENRLKGMSQHIIEYSTNPADCLEVVFALQKAAQQTHKAIAIVPPISHQISKAAPMDDTSLKKAESPLLKTDSVWSLFEESNQEKTVSDKLSQMAQQDNKSLENATAGNMADLDTSSASPVECQNDVQQSDCDSDDPSLELSSVPVIEYTLEKLMELVKSIEMTELSAGNPEKSQSILQWILQLYWNGKASNMLEPFKSFREALQLSIEYAKDYGSVVFKSIETENLKKLAHCDILKHETYSWSEEFRSSWLNVDGQPADIEKVLSEPLLDDITVFKATSQSFSDNTVVASASLGANFLTDITEEKSVNPDTCSPTDLFIQRAGNERGEEAAENNGHSYIVLREEGEKETFKKLEDISQNQTFTIEPLDITPLTERSTEKLTDHSNAKEVFRQDHKQTHDNVSDSLSLSPGDSVVSFSTETHYSSMDTWQVEDISDDENTGSKEALISSSDTLLADNISDDENTGSKEALDSSSDTLLVEDISDDGNTGSKEALDSSSDTLLVEDISDDGNTGKKEALNNTSYTWLVEDISDDENTGYKEALNNSSGTWLVKDISDDENSGNKDDLINSSNNWKKENMSNENPGNMGTPSNSADICAVKNESPDENSSDESLFMGITVLSSEDAKIFFQELEKEPECTIKTKSQSNFKCPDLIACFDAPIQLNQECNKAHTCSRCGSHIVKSSSTNVTKADSDADLFCLQCGEHALLFELEEEPCSPMTDKVNLLGSAAKSNELGQNYSLPCVKLEVNEPDVASTKECIAYEGLKGQKNDCHVKSDPWGNYSPPAIKIEVKELTPPKDECIAVEVLAEQKSVKSEQGHNCKSPSLELKIKKPNVSPLETCILKGGLTRQKKVSMVKSELVENRSPPSLELEIKATTVASTTECIADEGQKSDSIIQSELRQNCSLPSLEQEVKMPKVSSLEKCIADEGLKGPKKDTRAKSKMGQNHCSPSLEVKVKKSNFAFQKTCIADEVLVKSVTETMSKNQGSAERELTKIQPKKQKKEKTEKIRIPKPKSFTQCSQPLPMKTTFSMHKLKSDSTRTGSDNFVLFAPDIIVKKNWQQKKTQPGVSANKHRSGQSQNCSKVKKLKEHRQEKRDNPYRTSTNQRENLQTQKVSGHSSDASPHGSEKKLVLHGILVVNKQKRTEPKKVRFDLYGSKSEKQYHTPKQHFSAPAPLTVSDCKDYADELCAKQKVHNQWSSTFIPKTKTCPPSPRSTQESGPPKKKTLKPQDLLKSNMSALRNHLTHRAELLYNSERETSHLAAK
ncbi:uncharacterized protein LOC113048278 [Carassius auratus]|uniref:Uncharacterized protein LOC113048278 n=1 Tax=Carassius auratus TaxID=7957 RepID=A0A6P6K0Y0_CARAU|nr:uncharacterized protein LOC113048278 [Carassius auratus]XP_026065780.1 uncharacterized protein LOC113048278 [Carassius auratus]